MPKESLIYTPLLPLERRYIRRTALWMLGLMTVGCFALAGMVSLWYGKVPSDWKGLLFFGILIMAFAVPFHMLAGQRQKANSAWRRVFYIPAMLLNLLGVSLMEAAYYTRIGVEPPMSDLLAGALISVGVCLLATLCVYLLTNYLSLLSIIFGIAEVAGIVTCIVFWVKTGHSADAVVWSFALFNLLGTLIVSVAFIYAANEVSEICGEGSLPSFPEESADHGPGETEPEKDHTDVAWGWMRFLSFASFGVFLLVGVIVILVIAIIGGGACDCDCGDDCCEGCDCADGHMSSTKKKKRL